MQDTINSMPVQESPDLPPPMMQQPKKSNKTLIIVLVVVFVLCCICLPCFGGAAWLWNNGDSFINEFQDMSFLINIV